MTTPELYLTDRFTRAVNYARHLHIEQRRGTSIPSMAHLLGVASLVMGEVGQVAFPVTEDMVIAALLHDAVEDHGGEPRLHDIEANFGANVAGMVEGLSDTLVEDPGQKEPWEKRKAEYIERLRNEPAEVKLISAADKLYNARTLLDEYRTVGEQVWERFKRGRREQLWYFHELVKTFKASEPNGGRNRIVDELGRVVAELERATAGDSVQMPAPTAKA
jgi:(p)ppGpp synthase/HD superfamily hydrolase